MKTGSVTCKVVRATSEKRDNVGVKTFEEAVRRFDKLVERGVAKPRGNNTHSFDHMISNKMHEIITGESFTHQ